MRRKTSWCIRMYILGKKEKIFSLKNEIEALDAREREAQEIREREAQAKAVASIKSDVRSSSFALKAGLLSRLYNSRLNLLERDRLQRKLDELNRKIEKKSP